MKKNIKIRSNRVKKSYKINIISSSLFGSIFDKMKKSSQTNTEIKLKILMIIKDHY